MSLLDRMLCAGLMLLVPCTVAAQEPESDVLALNSLLNIPIDASGKYQQTVREAASAVTIVTRNPNAARVLRVVAIGLDESGHLGATLLREGVQVLHVTPLRAVAMSSVEEGLTVGVDANGDRPQIVINLAASRAEGAAFAGQLLSLARLTGPESSAP
jgi:hypothetical protein